MRRSAAPTYKHGDDDLTLLFDTGEVDHVHCLIADLADPASEALREAMAQSLRDLLGEPIEKLRVRIFESGRGANAVELEPLDRFALGVRLAALRLSECPVLSEELAQEYADDLKRVWINFIAYGAAHRMYWDLPREMETNKRKTRAMIAHRLDVASVESVDKDSVIAEYARRKAIGERGLRNSVAAAFNIKPNYVKNIWNERDREKYPD